jgi:hypothetical protein
MSNFQRFNACVLRYERIMNTCTCKQTGRFGLGVYSRYRNGILVLTVYSSIKFRRFSLTLRRRPSASNLLEGTECSVLVTSPHHACASFSGRAANSHQFNSILTTTPRPRPGPRHGPLKVTVEQCKLRSLKKKTMWVIIRLLPGKLCPDVLIQPDRSSEGSQVQYCRYCMVLIEPL